MGDFVYYRFPNETVRHRKEGQFQEIEAGKEPNGFVVTDFLHQRMLQLVETTLVESNTLHFKKEPPIVISRRDYQLEAQALLNSFDVMGVKKVVYSRVKSVHFQGENAIVLFEELCQHYPAAFIYLFSSEEFGTWIGATPEVLINGNSTGLDIAALAGTRLPNSIHPWGEKELQEHQYVVEAIEATLHRNTYEIALFEGPNTVSTGPIEHLKSTFQVYSKGQTNPWQLALDLHPTPAVCGTPRMAALDLLTSREMHERLCYTGIVGFYEPNNFRLFVNLRCAQLQSEKAYLYVGGGFTKDSIPDMEWDETENKARTLLQCMEKI